MIATRAVKKSVRCAAKAVIQTKKTGEKNARSCVAFQKRGAYISVRDFVKAQVGELSPELIGTYPYLSEAEQTFLSAIRQNDKIAIYGDYDADGVTSLSILHRVTDAFHANAVFIAPGRFRDGYGINKQRVQQMIQNDVKMILTVDNGIAANDAITLAKKNGLSVIILDHHEQASGQLPDADVICDPHVTGGDPVHGFHDLCGAGLSYLFAKDLILQNLPEKKNILDECLVLAAIGTVADVVSLQYDNRYIVQHGLSLIRKGIMPAGLHGILSALQIDPSQVSETDIAWKVAPLINAAGRVSNKGASVMTKILSAKEESSIRDLIEKSLRANELRKVMTEDMTERAKLYVKSLSAVPPFILYQDNAKTAAGIAGIIAAKLAGTYHVPAIVVTRSSSDPSVLKGSGRTYQMIDLLQILNKAKMICPELTFGGHAGACGVQFPAEKLECVRDALSSVTPKAEVHNENILWYDLCVPSEALLTTLSEEELCAPFGEGCPLPVIDTTLHVRKAFLMGNGRHVKFITGEGVDVVFWNGANSPSYQMFLSSKKKTIEVVGTLEKNVYNGKITPQLTAIGFC